MRRLVWYLCAVLVFCTPLFASPTGKGGVDSERVRKELAQILSRNEYDHSAKMNAVDRFLMRIGTAIKDGLGRVWHWLVSHLTLGRSSSGSKIATVGAWFVIAGFVVLAWFIARKLVANHGGGGSASEESDAANYDLPSAKPLIKQAAKLAEQGDYRGAFRAAYMACIAYLDEVRAVRFERSRTNWEYLRELKQGGHEKPYGEMRPLTLDFDRKIYGREDCSKTDYESAAAAYSRLSSEEAK
jgi:hypothetical protein